MIKVGRFFIPEGTGMRAASNDFNAGNYCWCHSAVLICPATRPASGSKCDRCLLCDNYPAPQTYVDRIPAQEFRALKDVAFANYATSCGYRITRRTNQPPSVKNPPDGVTKMDK